MRFNPEIEAFHNFLQAYWTFQRGAPTIGKTYQYINSLLNAPNSKIFYEIRIFVHNKINILALIFYQGRAERVLLTN